MSERLAICGCSVHYALSKPEHIEDHVRSEETKLSYTRPLKSDMALFDQSTVTAKFRSQIRSLRVGLEVMSLGAFRCGAYR
jgi:hypothetical protein